MLHLLDWQTEKLDTGDRQMKSDQKMHMQIHINYCYTKHNQNYIFWCLSVYKTCILCTIATVIIRIYYATPETQKQVIIRQR